MEKKVEDPQEVLDRAHELGYCGLFGSRDTIAEAGQFGLDVLKRCAVDSGDNIALTTALAVLMNTGALIQARLEAKIREMEEKDEQG